MAAMEGEAMLQKIAATKEPKLLDPTGQPLPPSKSSEAEAKAAAEAVAVAREVKLKELTEELNAILASASEEAQWLNAIGLAIQLQMYAEMALATSGNIDVSKLPLFIRMYRRAASEVAAPAQLIFDSCIRTKKLLAKEASRCRAMSAKLRMIRENTPGLSTVEYGAVTPKTAVFPSATYVVGDPAVVSEFMTQLAQVYKVSGVKTAILSDCDTTEDKNLIPKQWWYQQGTSAKAAMGVLDPVLQNGHRVLMVPRWYDFVTNDGGYSAVFQLMEKGLILFMGLDEEMGKSATKYIKVVKKEDGSIESTYVENEARS